MRLKRNLRVVDFVSPWIGCKPENKGTSVHKSMLVWIKKMLMFKNKDRFVCVCVCMCVGGGVSKGNANDDMETLGSSKL